VAFLEPSVHHRRWSTTHILLLDQHGPSRQTNRPNRTQLRSTQTDRDGDESCRSGLLASLELLKCHSIKNRKSHCYNSSSRSSPSEGSLPHALRCLNVAKPLQTPVATQILRFGRSFVPMLRSEALKRSHKCGSTSRKLTDECERDLLWRQIRR
jgi:hypothetical protein